MNVYIIYFLFHIYAFFKKPHFYEMSYTTDVNKFTTFSSAVWNCSLFYISLFRK